MDRKESSLYTIGTTGIERMFTDILYHANYSESFPTISMRGRKILYNATDVIIAEMYEFTDNWGCDSVVRSTLEDFTRDSGRGEVETKLNVISSIIRTLYDSHIEPETIYNIIRDDLHLYMLKEDAEEYLAAQRKKEKETTDFMRKLRKL